MKNIKVVFANQKGGVGKSTLCMLFANYLSWKGKPVCIIDTDLQKTILMQRQKDVQIYEGEEPYSVQSFDVSAPELMQQLMDSASEVEGYVLFDSPGNVSEDGLVPLFTNADYIVCPYEYEDKTLDSTGHQCAQGRKPGHARSNLLCAQPDRPPHRYFRRAAHVERHQRHLLADWKGYADGEQPCHAEAHKHLRAACHAARGGERGIRVHDKANEVGRSYNRICLGFSVLPTSHSED